MLNPSLTLLITHNNCSQSLSCVCFFRVLRARGSPARAGLAEISLARFCDDASGASFSNATIIMTGLKS